MLFRDKDFFFNQNTGFEGIFDRTEFPHGFLSEFSHLVSF